MKSDVIVSLIKEIVKNEVKQQVKEEIVKMIKSGAITLNQKSTPSLASLTETKTKPKQVVTTQPPFQPKKEFTKNSAINEILNQTQPFTAAHRAEGGGMTGMVGGSVLDMIQRETEDDWGSIDMRNQSIESNIQTDNPEMDAVTKALTRDYTELVKRFK